MADRMASMKADKKAVYLVGMRVVSMVRLLVDLLAVKMDEMMEKMTV